MEIFYGLKESQSDPAGSSDAAHSSYPAGLRASQPVTGARCSGRWFPRRDRWLKRPKKQNATFIKFKPTHRVISLHLLLFPVILNPSFTLRFLSEPRCVGLCRYSHLRTESSKPEMPSMSSLFSSRLVCREDKEVEEEEEEERIRWWTRLLRKEEDSERFLMERMIMKHNSAVYVSSSFISQWSGFRRLIKKLI